eukprot:4705086-Prorocentrum_lima.AAC.1
MRSWLEDVATLDPYMHAGVLMDAEDEGLGISGSDTENAVIDVDPYVVAEERGDGPAVSGGVDGEE